MFYNSLRRSWGRISFSVFFAATIALIARAQSPPDVARQAPPIVRSIDVQYTGPATISRERILAQMRTKIGLPYSDTVAENDIRALYNTGQVQNVRIFGQPEGDGVKVIVVVQTRVTLTEVAIQGNEALQAGAAEWAMGCGNRGGEAEFLEECVLVKARGEEDIELRTSKCVADALGIPVRGWMFDVRFEIVAATG